MDKVDRRLRITYLSYFSCCLSFTTPDTAAAAELYSKTRVSITVPLPCRRSPRCCLPSCTADASGRCNSRTDAPGRCFIDTRHDAAGRVDAGPNALGHDDSQPVPRPGGSRGARGADDAGACSADALGERVGREKPSSDGRGARRDVPSCWVSVENGVIDLSTRDSIRVNCCIIMCVTVKRLPRDTHTLAFVVSSVHIFSPLVFIFILIVVFASLRRLRGLFATTTRPLCDDYECVGVFCFSFLGGGGSGSYFQHCKLFTVYVKV